MLIDVEAAIHHILSRISPLSVEAIPLVQSLNRVLATDILAPTALPPFANSSMDGFAIQAADVSNARPEDPVRLRVAMDIFAGSLPPARLKAGEAARIMTGAPLPDGADAIVPVEDTDVAWTPGEDWPLPEGITITRFVKSGDYVRPVGEDVQAGEKVLSSGTVISPAVIGVLAALGFDMISVYRQPRVAILSSGDELIEVHEALEPGKIRNSNSYVLAALVSQYGGLPHRITIARDNLPDVRRRFQEALAFNPDLIISSAGVSVGAHDVVRTVLDELGEVQLWRINLRPGKPLAYGTLQGVPFFGLPGNPVSAQVTFEVIVRPALLKLAGRSENPLLVEAVLTEDVDSDGRLTYLRVKLSRNTQGHLQATLTGTQSSGAMMSMVLADGLLILPAGTTKASAGQKFKVRLLRAV